MEKTTQGKDIAKRRWLATLAAVFSGIAVAILQNKAVACIVVLMDAFQISSSTAGWLSSAFCVTGIFFAFPAAIIVNRFGVRWAGFLSMLLSLAGSILGLFADDIALLMISRVFEGIGCGLIVVVVPSVISMWFPPQKRGFPMGLWSSWQFVAQALCFFFGMAITEISGWRGVWGASTIIAAIAMVFYVVLVKSPPIECNYANVETEEKVSIFGALKYKSLWLVSLGIFCFNFACFGFVTWVAPCWADRFAMDVEKANRFISIMYVIELPIVIFVGKIMDSVNRRRFCTITFFVYIFTAVAAFLLPNSNWIIPFILVYPIFEGAVITGLWTAVPQTVGENKYISVAVALFGMLQSVGMLIGPPVTGTVIDSFGWAAAAFPIGIAALVGTVSVFFTRLYGEEK